MEENFLQFKKSNVLRFGIKDLKGNETGNFLEFDLDDIELPFKYQELYEKDNKNKEWLKNQLIAISKRKDDQAKGALTKNQEDQFKAVKKFFEKEIEVYNIFLGENGVQKLLNGQKIGYSTFQELDELIETEILPKLKISEENIQNKIIGKYGHKDKKESEVLR